MEANLPWLANIMVPLMSGLATGLGGGFAALWGRFNPRVLSLLMGVAAGVGFAVIFFDLLPEAFANGGLMLTIPGTLAGILLGKSVDTVFPRIYKGAVCSCGHKGSSSRHSIYSPLGLKAGYLLALGIALHNLPEGLAIGAGMEADRHLGVMVALAIGIHNIPEGMALVGLLCAGGMPGPGAVIVATATGLLIPAGAIMSSFLVALTPFMLAFLLALGAGALLYVVWCELIPKSCSMHLPHAILGMAAGLVLSIGISLTC